jgi:hypothetical protein
MFEGNFTVGNMISGIFNFPDKSILNCKFINWKINSSTIFIDKNGNENLCEFKEEIILKEI